MNNIELLRNITLTLSSVAFSSVGTEWNYKNVVSTFTRLYLVTKGDATIYIGDKTIALNEGFMHLVPAFTHCSYLCTNEMEHYYATFTIQLSNNLSIYQLYDFNLQIEAHQQHLNYFKRLNEANPNMALPSKDPKYYQRIQSKNWNPTIFDAQRSLINSGLLNLLLSEFIGNTKTDLNKGGSQDILNAVKYIHSHINENLSVEKLANMFFLSAGHFSRKFKQLTHLTPLDYINIQRVKKAQLLLNTTTQSGVEIAEACGFKSNAYFCKIFKKYVEQSPGEYRKQQI